MMKTVAFGLVQIRCRHRNKCSFDNKLREQNFDNGVTLNMSCAILKILGVKEYMPSVFFGECVNLYFRYSIHLVDISSLLDPLSNTRTDHSLKFSVCACCNNDSKECTAETASENNSKILQGQFSSNLPFFSEVF